MDRIALEHHLRDACARVAACQEDVLSQRIQVRELERGGLDASVARSLLHIYEESREMAVFNRDCLARAVKMGHYTAGAGAAQPVDGSDRTRFMDDAFPYRLAA
jgi:hypothetical protein